MGDPELPRPVLTPAAFLLDLDGTLYTDRGAIPGGPATIAALRARGIPFRCVTNTTSRSRAGLAARLTSLGYDIGAAEILTPVVAASAYCRSRGLRRIAAYTPAVSLEDLEGVDVVAGGERATDAPRSSSPRSCWPAAACCSRVPPPLLPLTKSS